MLEVEYTGSYFLTAVKPVSIQELQVSSWDGVKVRSKTVLRPMRGDYQKVFLLAQDVARELGGPPWENIYRGIMDHAD